jgi:hypothetical protein
MKKLAIFFLLLSWLGSRAQDAWTVEAKNFDLKNYFGVTVANGMIGLV